MAGFGRLSVDHSTVPLPAFWLTTIMARHVSFSGWPTLVLAVDGALRLQKAVETLSYACYFVSSEACKGNVCDDARTASG